MPALSPAVLLTASRRRDLVTVASCTLLLKSEAGPLLRHHDMLPGVPEPLGPWEARQGSGGAPLRGERCPRLGGRSVRPISAHLRRVPVCGACTAPPATPGDRAAPCSSSGVDWAGGSCVGPWDAPALRDLGWRGLQGMGRGHSRLCEFSPDVAVRAQTWALMKREPGERPPEEAGSLPALALSLLPCSSLPGGLGGQRQRWLDVLASSPACLLGCVTPGTCLDLPEPSSLLSKKGTKTVELVQGHCSHQTVPACRTKQGIQGPWDVVCWSAPSRHFSGEALLHSTCPSCDVDTPWPVCCHHRWSPNMQLGRDTRSSCEAGPVPCSPVEPRGSEASPSPVELCGLLGTQTHSHAVCAPSEIPG